MSLQLVKLQMTLYGLLITEDMVNFVVRRSTN